MSFKKMDPWQPFRSENDTDADDADIRPIYDEEPMTEEKVFVIAALKNDLRKLKGNTVDTKFAKTPVLGKPVLQSLRNQSVVRQPNASKSERPRMSKPWWKPTGRIFKSVGLRCIPTGKLFDSCTSKVDSEPLCGLNLDIPNIHECKQTLDVSACTSINDQKEKSLDLSIVICSMNFNEENQVVSKSSAVTTADTSDKRQQQPDPTLSTSALATTVTADGNFNL
nr:hypothetical protein [Tanacetum cinerariifolium]